MWTQFAYACLLGLCILYVPGFLVLKTLKFSTLESLCFAPLVEVAFISVLSSIYGAVNIPASFSALVLPVFFAGCLGVLIRLKRHEILQHEDKSGAYGTLLLLYIAVGSVLALVLIGTNLGTADSYASGIDVTHHIASIRNFIESGNYSSWNASCYGATPAEMSSPVSDTNGFYPSAWHGIVALVVSTLHVPVTLGINAINTILIGMVFPVSMFVFIKILGHDRRLMLLVGAGVVLAFSAFPWDFLVHGPLYANLLSYCLLPAVLTLGMQLVCLTQHQERARLLFGFCAGCISIAFAQPNGLFALIVYLTPYVAHIAYTRVVDHHGLRSKALLAGMCVVVGALVVWLGLYSLPQLQAVTTFNWPRIVSLARGVETILVLRISDYAMQPFLAVFVLVGFVCAWKRPRLRWLCFSYIFLAISYVITISTDGPLKHVLTGFWYTDALRVAATLVIVAIPLAILGIIACGTALMKRMSHAQRRIGCAAYGLVVLAFLFYPDMQLSNTLQIHSSLGAVLRDLRLTHDVSQNETLNAEEGAFIREISAYISAGDLVINNPDDGSYLAYGCYGVPVLYRMPGIEQDSTPETYQSESIRLHLSEIATYPEVSEAVSQFGARYVMLLEHNQDDPAEESSVSGAYPGISSITDTTPGFKAILSSGSMRLYEIVQ